MSQGFRLRRETAGFEQSRLDGDTLRERQHHRRFNRLDDGACRRIGFTGTHHLGALVGKEVRRQVFCIGIDLAAPAWRRFTIDQRINVVQADSQRLAVDDVIDETCLQGCLHVHHAAAQHHVQCEFGTGEARHTLRAKPPREDAKRDLGKSHAGARQGNAVVASQRQLQPATQRRAVQYSNHQTIRLLDACQQAIERPGAEVRAIEGLDIGARHKRSPLAVDQQCLERTVGLKRIECRTDAIGDFGRNCVHRRIIYGEHGDAAVSVQRDCFLHDSLLLLVGQYFLGDDFFHDLAGAGTNIEQANIGEPLADRVFLHVAPTTVQRQAGIGDLVGEV